MMMATTTTTTSTRAVCSTASAGFGGSEEGQRQLKGMTHEWSRSQVDHVVNQRLATTWGRRQQRSGGRCCRERQQRVETGSDDDDDDDDDQDCADPFVTVTRKKAPPSSSALSPPHDEDDEDDDEEVVEEDGQELHRLIDAVRDDEWPPGKGWKRVVHRLETHAHEAVALDRRGRTSLMAALHKAAYLPQTVLCALLQHMQPFASLLTLQDKTGMTALLIALHVQAPVTTILNLLSVLGKQQVLTCNHRGELPLHVLLQPVQHHRRTLVTRQELDRRHELLPLLLSTADAQTQALWETHAGWTPLHVAVQARLPLSIIQQLVRACPAAVRRRACGYTPLIAALHAECPVPVLELLLRTDPNLIHVPDHQGRYPLQYALCPQEPNHHHSPRRRIYPAAVIACFAACPAAVQYRDAQGRNAVHVLLERWSVHPSEMQPALLARLLQHHDVSMADHAPQKVPAATLEETSSSSSSSSCAAMPSLSLSYEQQTTTSTSISALLSSSSSSSPPSMWHHPKRTPLQWCYRQLMLVHSSSPTTLQQNSSSVHHPNMTLAYAYSFPTAAQAFCKTYGWTAVVATESQHGEEGVMEENWHHATTTTNMDNSNHTSWFTRTTTTTTTTTNTTTTEENGALQIQNAWWEVTWHILKATTRLPDNNDNNERKKQTWSPLAAALATRAPPLVIARILHQQQAMEYYHPSPSSSSLLSWTKFQDDKCANDNRRLYPCLYMQEPQQQNQYPLHIACAMPPKRIKTTLDENKELICRLLLEAAPDVAAKADQHGLWPLHWAVQTGGLSCRILSALFRAHPPALAVAHPTWGLFPFMVVAATKTTTTTTKGNHDGHGDTNQGVICHDNTDAPSETTAANRHHQPQSDKTNDDGDDVIQTSAIFSLLLAAPHLCQDP